MDTLKKLLIANRSVRRFDASRSISFDTLENLVDLCRYCASGINIQPLKYRIVHTPEECDLVFPHLKWAGYYTDWDGPSREQRPVAYLIQCLDTEISADCLCDDGLQLEAITLGATEKGIGGCIIKAFNPAAISEALHLPGHLKPRYVLALGYPAEEIQLVDMDESAPEGFKYYRLPDGTHCVPKRPLSSILI